jgi:hypothetical protein
MNETSDTTVNAAEKPVNDGGGTTTTPSMEPYEESMPIDPPTNDGGGG